MSSQQDSPAVAVARAHVAAWSSKDFDTARSMLAPDVHVIAITTNPALPATDLTGADAYMEGLAAFAAPIVSGSVRELAAAGDERNALLTLDLRVAGGPFGAGAAAPCARLYLVEDGKIKTEQVIFYVTAP
jgi:ketosteroid isomerase-like protein